MRPLADQLVAVTVIVGGVALVLRPELGMATLLLWSLCVALAWGFAGLPHSGPRVGALTIPVAAVLALTSARSLIETAASVGVGPLLECLQFTWVLVLGLGMSAATLGAYALAADRVQYRLAGVAAGAASGLVVGWYRLMPQAAIGEAECYNLGLLGGVGLAGALAGGFGLGVEWTGDRRFLWGLGLALAAGVGGALAGMLTLTWLAGGGSLWAYGGIAVTSGGLAVAAVSGPAGFLAGYLLRARPPEPAPMPAPEEEEA